MAKKLQKDNPQADIQSNRVMLVIALAFIYTFGLMFLYRGLLHTPSTILLMLSVVRGLAIGLGVLFFASLCFLGYAKSKKLDTKNRSITPQNLAIVCGLCLLAMLSVVRYDIHAIRVLYVLIPAAAALYLIANVYRRGVMLVVLAGGAQCGALYVANRGLSRFAANTQLMMVAVWAALCLLALLLVGTKGGKGKGLVLLPKKRDRLVLQFAFLLPLAALGGFFAVGITAIRYGFYAMIFYLMVSLVLYTGELMNR